MQPPLPSPHNEGSKQRDDYSTSNHSVASFATNNKNSRYKLPSTASDIQNNSRLVRSSEQIFNPIAVSTKNATFQSFLFISLLPSRKYSNPKCSRTGHQGMTSPPAMGITEF